MRTGGAVRKGNRASFSFEQRRERLFVALLRNKFSSKKEVLYEK
jgi:hypothetical protein